MPSRNGGIRHLLAREIDAALAAPGTAPQLELTAITAKAKRFSILPSPKGGSVDQPMGLHGSLRSELNAD